MERMVAMMTTGLSANVSHTWTWQDVEWGAWDAILQMASACLGTFGNLVVIMVLFHQRPVSRSTDNVDRFSCCSRLFDFVVPVTFPESYNGTFQLARAFLLLDCVYQPISVYMHYCLNVYSSPRLF